MNSLDNESNRTVALVGAGLIGRSWAVVFASAGWTVRLTDQAPEVREALPALIRASLEDLREHGLCPDPDAVMQRIEVASTLEEAVHGVSLVQESLPETAEAKAAIFAELDRLAPADAILASSTSAIVASLFTRELRGRHRCLVAHPVNPPHLVPLVELCPAPWTDAAVLERARSIYADAGQVPILVRKEVEGFVLNRLQGALLTEALRLAVEGVASPDDIDKAVRDGLGLRWSFMGPFETIELNAPGGVADYGRRYGAFYGRLAADPPSPEVWTEARFGAMAAARRGHAEASQLDAKRAWRDGRLAAFVAHRRSMPQWSDD